MNARPNLIMLAAAMLLGGCAMQRVSLRVEGRTRTCLVDLSRSSPTGARRLPLVLVLHGHGGTARKARRLSGMSEEAAARGFIAAYPEGASWLNTPWRSWNAGYCCGYAKAKQVDDLVFLRALLEELKRRYPVDPGRVYVTGISNGGMLAYRAACEMAGELAGIGVVAGAMPPGSCNPSRPVPVAIIHGTSDRLIRYEGGRSQAKDGRVDASVAEAVAFWTAHNRTGAEVALRTISGGRHAWPRGASKTLWDFFARQATQAPAQ